MDLTTPHLLLRAPRAEDLPHLVRILAAPEVARRWPGYDGGRVRSELIERVDGVVVRVVEHAGVVAGAIQHEASEDPEYAHVGMDLFLDPGLHGRGLASEAIRAVIAEQIAAGHHRFVIDPAADNLPAIRAYAATGFRVVGRMRAYERGPDGSFHDGLLMELLAADLAPEAGAVRRARPADAAAVAELANALDRHVGRPGLAHDRGTALLAIATNDVIVAERGGRVAGYALFHPAYDTDHARPGVVLEDVFVEPDARGTGLGTALLARVAREALASSAASLRWSVRSADARARRFYASLGAADEDDRVLSLAGETLARLARR